MVEKQQGKKATRSSAVPGIIISCATFGLAFIAFSGCEKQQESGPKTTFDGPFPKRNIALTRILGDHLTLKRPFDTVSLKITTFKNYNLITETASGDTLFCGPVSKFRGLYYFSHQLNDTAYWIYAVRLNGNLVYGLNSAFEQTLLVDEAIEAGKHPKLVKYRTPQEIRLHPEKREMKGLFNTILGSVVPDTILQNRTISSVRPIPEKGSEKIAVTDNKFLSNFYPNPATDFLNVELRHADPVIYQVTDLTGKIVLRGSLTNLQNQIDLRQQADGIYALTLVNSKNSRKETVKIVKQNRP